MVSERRVQVMGGPVVSERRVQVMGGPVVSERRVQNNMSLTHMV